MNGVPFTPTHPDSATLGAYHDDELRGFARAEIADHVQTCPRCRRELEDLNALDGALRALPLVEPPAAVYDAVLARVRESSPRRRSWRPAWAIAAVLALLAALAGAVEGVTHSPTLMPAAEAPMHRTARSGLSVEPHSPGVFAPNQGRASGAAPPAHGPTHAVAAPSVPVPSGPPSGGTGQKGPHTMVLTPKRGVAATIPRPPSIDARLIVRDGEIELRVHDVQKTFDAVSGIATQQGGYVANSDNNASTATQGAYAATLTLRVPAANFTAAMSAIVALPHTRLTQKSSSEDITSSYQDLQAHVQALQATRSQLMALLRQAHSVRDAMTVLNRLTAINTQIDAVQGQIMASSDSVMLSTITVNLTAQPKKSPVVAPVKRKPQQWQPGRDLASALANLRRALEAVISFAIYLAVYLVVPALLAALALLTRRLWRGAPHRA